MDPSIIAAGVSAVGGIVDNIANIGQGRKARKWQEKMMDKQNAYNSPVQQMERLKQAGLNPHLVYGSGNSVQSSASPASSPAIPQSNFGEVATNYITNRLTARLEQNAIATNENIKADTLNKEEQINESKSRQILQAAQTADVVTKTAKTKLEYDIASDLKMNTIETAYQNLENMKKQGSLTEAQTATQVKDLLVKDSQIKLNTKSLDKISQDIAESKQRINNLIKDGKLKDAEVLLKQQEYKLRQIGLNPNGATWQNVIGLGLQELTEGNPIKQLGSAIKKNWQTIKTNYKNWKKSNK